MQKVDRDWLAANDAHPHVLHLADVLNSIVDHLTGEHHLVQATDEATDGEVEATDPSGDA